MNYIKVLKILCCVNLNLETQILGMFLNSKININPTVRFVQSRCQPLGPRATRVLATIANGHRGVCGNRSMRNTIMKF